MASLLLLVVAGMRTCWLARGNDDICVIVACFACLKSDGLRHHTTMVGNHFSTKKTLGFDNTPRFYYPTRGMLANNAGIH